MPIRPERQRLYPGGSIRSPEWLAIREAILERAGYRCEGSPRYPDCRAADREPHPVTGSRVVLTIAHLDHDPTNSEDCNLLALCQKCHLSYDAADKARRRKERTMTQEEDIQPDESSLVDTMIDEAIDELEAQAAAHEERSEKIHDEVDEAMKKIKTLQVEAAAHTQAADHARDAAGSLRQLP